MGEQWRYGKRRFGSVAELLVRAAQIVECLRCGLPARLQPCGGSFEHADGAEVDPLGAGWTPALTFGGAAFSLGLSLGLAHARIETN
jgi:hypothetical protein